MKRLIRAALTKLGIRAPRCDSARIQPPRFGAAYLYIEQCRLTAGHRGDHQPGLPEPVDAATALTRHDQDHGHYTGRHTMTEPNWQELVLAHLTNTEYLEPEDLDNPERWRHAYATLMSMRGQVDPPELIADLGRRMDALESSVDGTHGMHLAIFDRQDKNTNKLTERLNFVEMQVRYGDTAEGGKAT